jgi:Protein of unknown function (DUF2934)
MSTDRSFDVSERAYAIWEQAGCPEGKALDNWLQAEAELSEAPVPPKSDVPNIVPQKRRRMRKA